MLEGTNKTFDFNMDSERLSCVRNPENKIVFTGTVGSCNIFILKNQSHSTIWAKTHGGWAILEHERMTEEETYLILNEDPYSKLLGQYEKETSDSVYFTMNRALWRVSKNACSWRPNLKKGDIVYATNNFSKKCE